MCVDSANIRKFGYVFLVLVSGSNVLPGLCWSTSVLCHSLPFRLFLDSVFLHFFFTWALLSHNSFSLDLFRSFGRIVMSLESAELWSVLEASYTPGSGSDKNGTVVENHKKSPESLPLHITWLLPAIAHQESGKDTRKLIGKQREAHKYHKKRRMTMKETTHCKETNHARDRRNDECHIWMTVVMQKYGLISLSKGMLGSTSSPRKECGDATKPWPPNINISQWPPKMTKNHQSHRNHVSNPCALISLLIGNIALSSCPGKRIRVRSQTHSNAYGISRKNSKTWVGQICKARSEKGPFPPSLCSNYVHCQLLTGRRYAASGSTHWGFYFSIDFLKSLGNCKIIERFDCLVSIQKCLTFCLILLFSNDTKQKGDIPPFALPCAPPSPYLAYVLTRIACLSSWIHHGPIRRWE